MKISIYLDIIFAFSLLAVNVSAQEPTGTDTTTAKYKKHYALKLTYQAGNVFPTNNFYKGTDSNGNQTNENAEPIKYYHAATIQIGRQTDGSKLWEQLYVYPYWGIGLSGINFFNQNELGTPSTIFAFINAPFKRWDKLSLNYEIGFGIAFDWEPFNEDYNSYQIVIGSKKTAYFDAGINLIYQLSKRFDASIGYSLSHFSNGGIVQPDYGVNLGGPKIGIKYIFKDRPEFIKQEIPEYKKENEWLMAINLGVKQVIFDTAHRKYIRVNYKVFGITSTYNWQTHHKSKWGAGIDFSYDGAINAQIDIDDNKVSKVESPFIDKFSIGVYPSYELVCNKISIILQSGIYVLRKNIDGQTPLFYQRIGVKYHIFQNAFVGINVRAYDFTVADYIEWSIGYRIKWLRN